MMPYLPLLELILLIDEPQQAACRQILADHGGRFVKAPGSTHNHQAWTGGYTDHITEAMNVCIQLYGVLDATGRLPQLPADERFTLSDALVVLFVHDLEKPWRHVIQDGQPARNADGSYLLEPALISKAARTGFVAQVLTEYGLALSPIQALGLRYVEGVRDRDYTPGRRVMTPLGAFVHTCDLWSARLFYGFPLAANDPWRGARRSNH